jgi:hypothetical protein
MNERMIHVGAREVTMSDAKAWVASYFDPAANRVAQKPFAYPAYDLLDTGSDANTLNDGDLLAPTLLNAAPTIAGFFSLQRCREKLQSGLTGLDPTLSLSQAVSRGVARGLLGDLVSVLDDDALRLRGIRLTKLAKVLHRKRPLCVPLYDKFVKACYVGHGDRYPISSQSWTNHATYFGDIALAMCVDLDSQPERFEQLSRLAPTVSVLRVLDVLAWNAGRRAE